MRAYEHRKWQASFFALILLVTSACGGASAENTPDAQATPDINIPIEELLVYVPAGSFQMGSQPDIDILARPDEFPLHLVRLDGFHIFRNEVTNGLYAQCVAAGECTPPDVIEDGPSEHYGEEEYKDHPVVGVDWDQAVAFCTWVDARLPTEAEWEKTARGEVPDLYPWGDDAPTCDLSNMESCVPDTETDKIGQYPEGESVYEAKDMSGNVWEWTADWYNEEYYDVSVGANPLGPENGELKVIRGGSFESGPVDLRAAARFALDPDDGYNNVGFRCVPIGTGLGSPGQAPFCQTSYIPFCADPNNPPGEDCTPPTAQQGTPTADGQGFEWLGFGCPSNGIVTFTIDAGGPAADDYTVEINGITYNCVDSTVNPGRLICTGAAQPANTYVNISVCPNGSAAQMGPQLIALQPTPIPAAAKSLMAVTVPQKPAAQLIAYQPQQVAGLDAFQPAPANQPQLMAFQAATNGFCPDGMLYNEATGLCETDPNGGDACPDGWTYEATGQCAPPNAGACPDGTTFSADQQMCLPDNGSDCPAPYFYDEATGACQPPANNDGGGACPDGYFYDENILCCSPIQTGNNGCEEGTYRDAATGACEPLNQDGCPEGTVYNRYEGSCLPDNGETPAGDAPVNQRTVGGCTIDQYYDPATQQCIDLPDGQCGPGYYYDARMQSCRPTDGPGSGCAIGTAFSERLNCCVPTPGQDGSSCAGEPTANGNTPVLRSLVPPSLTGYDYGTGYCDPNGGNSGCPQGYAPNSDGVCSPISQTGQPANDDGSCNEGFHYDEAYATCLPDGVAPANGCQPGQYFDYDLGYCVQANCGGCALGFTYNYDLQTCVPDGQTSTNGQGCWVTTQTVPVCPYPTSTPGKDCPAGEEYNPRTNRCDARPTQGPTSGGGGGGSPACGTYTNAAACTAAGCTWLVFGAGAVCQ